MYIPELTEVELESLTKINADREISKILCGKSRSGHFDGVCTIVNHFFKTIKPDFAVFGEKDFQQVKIIEQMILEQAFNITLIPAPIFREASGLAMSSRNSYLDDQEKTQAAFIYESILKEKQLLEDLLFPPQEEQILNSINTIKEKLSNAGFRVDYVEFHWSRIFVAAYLGNTRLIDNIEIVT